MANQVEKGHYYIDHNGSPLIIHRGVGGCVMLCVMTSQVLKSIVRGNALRVFELRGTGAI